MPWRHKESKEHGSPGRKCIVCVVCCLLCVHVRVAGRGRTERKKVDIMQQKTQENGTKRENKLCGNMVMIV